MKGLLRLKNRRYEIRGLDVGELTLSVTYLNPDQSTRGHQHPYPEGYYFGKGLGKLQLGEEKVVVSEGHFILIPENTFHRVFNDGLLSLVFICAFRREEG